MTQPPKPSLNRRRLFAGASTVGAVAAVTAVLPGLPAADTTAATPERRPAPANGGGYTVSEHVKRYYQTARV